MAVVHGGRIGPDPAQGDGRFRNEVQTDRAAWWVAMGGKGGILRGLVHSGVGGQMQLSFTAGAASVPELDGSGVETQRGYLVWADTATVVQFGAASASARNDAVVAAAIDTEAGAVGTGALVTGGHLVVIPGVSGTSAVRTDAQIRAWLGRGGYLRLMDVPIASSDTQINVANIVVTATNGYDSGWINIGGGVVTGTLRYRVKRGSVFVHCDGSATSVTATFLTLNPGNALPAWVRPSGTTRGGAYFGSGFNGVLSVQTDGLITGVQATGANRASVAGIVSYPLE